MLVLLSAIGLRTQYSGQDEYSQIAAAGEAMLSFLAMDAMGCERGKWLSSRALCLLKSYVNEAQSTFFLAIGAVDLSLFVLEHNCTSSPVWSSVVR